MHKTVWVNLVLLGLLLVPVTAAGPTAAQRSALQAPPLFTLMRSVDVTPVDNLAGGSFVRIGYVPGKDRIVVTFSAKLGQPVEGCGEGFGYSYSEYNLDMVGAGDSGIISCQPGIDWGGLIDGDFFYLAAMVPRGWNLTKYDAVTWKALVGPLFHELATEEENADPMLARVNGQIDVSSTYVKENEPRGPDKSHATHHQFFTPDLQFIDKRILSDIPHIDLNSMISVNNVTTFVTGTALLGDVVVMQYDPEWNYLGGKTILQKAACPEGLASDGTWFYVAYLDDKFCTSFPCYQNVHLAAFDSNWNLIEDVAVTDYTPDDHKQTSRPTLALWNNRVYVAWDQTNNETFSGGDPRTADTQVYAKVYEVRRP